MTTSTIESYRQRLARALPDVRARIADAAGRAGRAPSGVRLVGVTKGHPAEAVRAALSAGLRDLGENRVSELEDKRAELGDSAARWHFIGHIQSRKARRAAEAADIIHSVDSVKLARKLSNAASERKDPLPVLVQVNTSGEAAKGGLEGDGLVEEICGVAELPGLEVRGLMTMAPLSRDERILRGTFAGLRGVLERTRAACPAVGEELSMGMTNDFEIAVEEGSTVVRIGTALFGERGAP